MQAIARYEHLNPHFISDTATHTGRFWKIVSLEDSEFHTLVGENFTGNALTTVVFKASCEIQGVFTSIKLNGGAVVAYRI
tara:strand:+ start:2888 stop:3127 length:240 start_codon:yes stop_codon:yes gene_type:complete